MNRHPDGESRSGRQARARCVMHMRITRVAIWPPFGLSKSRFPQFGLQHWPWAISCHALQEGVGRSYIVQFQKLIFVFVYFDIRSMGWWWRLVQTPQHHFQTILLEIMVSHKLAFEFVINSTYQTLEKDVWGACASSGSALMPSPKVRLG